MEGRKEWTKMEGRKEVNSRITLQRQAHVLRMNENGREEGRKEERNKN